MSLVKQLWLATALLMTLAFGGSLVTSVLSARHYLEQELKVKNMDNAASLALSMTQLDKDPTTLELQIAAQFDVGHYRFIRLSTPDGQTLAERTNTNETDSAPAWFVRLIPVQAPAGQALIQNGWKQYGTLTLASHEGYAYKSLWEGTLQLLGWFVLSGIATGLLGTLAIRWITRPLRNVVQQAHAIAERRFETLAEPGTPELRAVTRAMNHMVERLQSMFAEEAARLDSLRRKVNQDAVTGLANREHFMAHLREVLEGEQFSAAGSLVIVRLAHLNELNAKLGRQRADALLQNLGAVLQTIEAEQPGQRAGRVKGGEFAIICPTEADPATAAQHIHHRLLQDWWPHWQEILPDLFHLGAVGYQRHQGLGDLLTHADQTLAQAQAQGVNCWYAAPSGHAAVNIPAEQWRTLLTEAVQGDQLSLAFYPVVGGQHHQALHQEGVIRLQLNTDGQRLSAGDFMPMAATLNLSAPIDLSVVRLAIEHLQQRTGDIAVNLSAETIADFGFSNQLVQLLQNYPTLCPRLLFEVPEYGVLKQFDAFCHLVRNIKQLGCRIGIEYFGQNFVQTDKLSALGLDYIKVHPNYIRGIQQHAGNQEFLRGLCNMAHALGIVVIALGVEQADDLPLLTQLGFDGATGPGVR